MKLGKIFDFEVKEKNGNDGHNLREDYKNKYC